MPQKIARVDFDFLGLEKIESIKISHGGKWRLSSQQNQSDAFKFEYT